MELRPPFQRGLHGPTANKNEITEDPKTTIPIALHNKLMEQLNKVSEDHMAGVERLQDKLSAERAALYSKASAERKATYNTALAEHKEQLKQLAVNLSRPPPSSPSALRNSPLSPTRRRTWRPSPT